MNTITIDLQEPILPTGARITAEIDRGHLTQGLKDLSAAIDSVFEQSDKSRDTSPGERGLIKRMDAIERAIIQTLPAEARLQIANEVAAR